MSEKQKRSAHSVNKGLEKKLLNFLGKTLNKS